MRFTQSQWDDFARVVRDWRADGLSAVRSSRRENPLGAAASNIVGIIADYADHPDGPVKTELEFAQDAVLRPEDGYVTAFQDRNGYILPNRVIDPGRPAKNGQDIRLTIDSEVQKTAYGALKTLVMREQVDGASAVVMIPKTGEILAATSFPSIDPETGYYDGFTPRFANKPQTITVEAGSTFKTISLAIALQEGKTTLHNSYIDCPMWFKVGSRVIHCDRSHSVHGHMDSVKAIAVSCNKAAATWAMAVGPKKFQSYIKRMGLLAKPGIFSPASEKFGDFNDKDPAKELQTATVGFGQNIRLTPIGLLTGFATIANDGIRPTAHLIDRIGDEAAPMPTIVDRKIDVDQGNKTAVGERIFSPEVCGEVKEAMKAVFYGEGGTGKNLKIPGFTLAGKTGTAETGKKRDGRSANFIGFIPAEKPEAVILVMIQNHRRKFYGGKYAGEVFQKIALTCIDQLHIPCSDPAAFRTWRQKRMEDEKKLATKQLVEKNHVPKERA
jgi:cell division protein FtsI/penicillin-binding protein 2